MRGATHIKPQDVPDQPQQWCDSRHLHASNPARIATNADQSQCTTCLLAGGLCQNTKRPGKSRPAHATQSFAFLDELKAAAREREPWLIVAAPELRNASARQLVKLYARRIQFELAFRDLKSHSYGHGMEDSLTRQGQRLQILLLVSTLASFVSWLAGMACQAASIAHSLWLTTSTRKLYSTVRVGREALVRLWPLAAVTRWLDQLRSPQQETLDQMCLIT